MTVFLGNHQGRDPGNVGTLHPKPQRLCTPALLEPVKPEFRLVGSPSTGARNVGGVVGLLVCGGTLSIQE